MPVNPEEMGAQKPQSDRENTRDDRRAHTNYNYLSQDVTKFRDLGSVILKKEKATLLQIVRPHSDLTRRSSEEQFARLAMTTGNPPPKGAVIKAHTDYEYLVNPNSPIGIAIDDVKNNTPSEIRNRYGIPNEGGGGLIIIVDAYKYPTAESDLLIFSKKFNLPDCTTKNGCLTIQPLSQSIRADTDPSVSDCGWSQEAAIDLQWAHAIAPQARLVLVEATTSDRTDMLAAVDKATKIAEDHGGGIVSLSWSYDETPDEEQDDFHFKSEKVLFFAASGDDGGRVEYPAASPYVVSVGGTELLRDENDTIIVEKGWNSAGGGNSNFEPRPTFQSSLENISDTGRVVPDIAGPAGLDSDLQNGSPIYAGTVCAPYKAYWYSVGGTSLATPIVAAEASYSYPHGLETKSALANIYHNRSTQGVIRDITVGQAGANVCKAGYDKCSGVGVPASTKFVSPP